MHKCANHKSCVDSALRAADMICADRGLRFTALRRKVLTIIWARHRPAKAYDILSKLKRKSVSAQPPTVYRALDFLLAHGLIHKVSSLNAYIGCAHPLKAHECYFLICRQCGEITECCNSQLARAISGTAGKNKFKPSRTTLEIKGECRDCINIKRHQR